MYTKVGSTIKKIRSDKGYTQNAVLKDAITQSAMSKFERNETDIKYSTLAIILENLEMSFEEFSYVHHNYEFSEKELVYKKFFSLTYNEKEEILLVSTRAKKYLELNEDCLIEDIKDLCDSLIIFIETSNHQVISKNALKVWARLSKKNQFYLTDLYLLNSIIYFFSLETMLEIKKLAYKSIDRYKDFQNIHRLKINLGVNLALMLMKRNLYKEALKEIDETIRLAKITQTYLQLAVCYIRKGVCLNQLHEDGDNWIRKGKDILNVLEERSLLQMAEDEIRNLMEGSMEVES